MVSDTLPRACASRARAAGAGGPPSRQASAICPRSPSASVCRPSAAGSGRIATPRPRAASCASTPVSLASNAIRARTPVASQDRTHTRAAREADQRVRRRAPATSQRGARRQRVAGARPRPRSAASMITCVSTPAGASGPSEAHARSSVPSRTAASSESDSSSVSVISTSGCARVERRQQVGQRHRRARHDHPHAHMPAHQPAQLLDRLPHARPPPPAPPRERQHRRARLGQRHRAPAALQQLLRRARARASDLRADAGLRHQHALGGAREAPPSTTATKYSSCRSSIRRDASWHHYQLLCVCRSRRP